MSEIVAAIFAVLILFSIFDLSYLCRISFENAKFKFTFT